MYKIAEFTEYMNNFYGKGGVYPSTRTLTIEEVANAVIEDMNKRVKTNPDFVFDGDSIDRERIRDILFTEKEQEKMYAPKEAS